MPTINDVQYYRKLLAFLKISSSGCWEWQRSMNKDGYGQTCYRGKQIGAHHLMMILIGDHENGLFVDHICKNRKCCNPKHLRMVSPTENTLGDNSKNPTAINLRKTHCKHGHEFTNENTGHSMDRGRRRRYCKKCHRKKAAEYRRKKGVKDSTPDPSLSHLQQFC